MSSRDWYFFANTSPRHDVSVKLHRMSIIHVENDFSSVNVCNLFAEYLMNMIRNPLCSLYICFFFCFLFCLFILCILPFLIYVQQDDALFLFVHV